MVRSRTKGNLGGFGRPKSTSARNRLRPSLSKSFTTASRWPGVCQIITLVLVLAFGAMVIYAVYLLATVTRGMSIYELESEAARLASTLYFEKLTAVAQTTVALLGALWVFRTFADTRVDIRGWHVVTCFWLTNLSFAFSLIVHYGYGYDFIISRMFYHFTFDIDAPFVRFVSDWQLAFFIFGCVCFVLTATFGTKRSAT